MKNVLDKVTSQPRILIDRDCGKLTRHSKIVSNFVDNLLKEILLVMTFLRQLVASIVITQ